MKKVGIIYDAVLLSHEPPAWHPDSPARLTAIIGSLKASGLWNNGNSTQHIFEEDDSVFYFSTHQHPYYPDTGKDMDRGDVEGVNGRLKVEG